MGISIAPKLLLKMKHESIILRHCENNLLTFCWLSVVDSGSLGGAVRA